MEGLIEQYSCFADMADMAGGISRTRGKGFGPSNEEKTIMEMVEKLTNHPETGERLINCRNEEFPEGEIQVLWRELENLEKLAAALDFRSMSK